ncbi:MAG: Ig-like domain-containing protein [Rudaea sp.]|nr:Ig-like domain-containing protein [Rudaea sp.]
MQFNPIAVGVGQESALTIQITNPNTVAQTGLAFVNTLPTGLVVGTPPQTNTCGGVLTANGTTISLSGGTVPASSVAVSGSCTVVVDVTGDVPGWIYTDGIPTADLMTDQGNTNSNDAFATLIVVFPPTVAKQFSPTSIAVEGVSSLTITLGNPNIIALTLASDFVDTLPVGLIIASPAQAATTCLDSTVIANPGTGSLTLANGSQIPANGCTVSANVTANGTGVFTNTIAAGAFQTNAGTNPNAASAMLNISAASTFTTLSTGCETTFVANQSFVMMATVTGDNPGGTSTFSDSGVPIDTCTSTSLSVGAASCSTSSLPIGMDTLTAVYGGDGNNQSSNSNSLSVLVLDPTDVLFRNGFEADITGCPIM